MTKCSLAREGESDASAGSTEGPNQDEPKEASSKTYHN